MNGRAERSRCEVKMGPRGLVASYLHAALALFYQVDRSTITRAVHEIRPLLAARGFAVPGEPGLRLRTLADVFAYAASQGVHLRIDGTEVQVRRPGAGCCGGGRSA